MFTPLEPRLKRIAVVPINKYARNLMLSSMNDVAILPSDGGGYSRRKKVDGQDTDQGNYKQLDLEYSIQRRKNMRKALGIDMSINDNKLPRPVTVSNLDIITQQVTKNISDPNYLTINDLSEKDRNDLLGNDKIQQSIQETNPMYFEIETMRKAGATKVPIDIESDPYQNVGRVVRNLPISKNALNTTMRFKRGKSNIKK